MNAEHIDKRLATFKLKDEKVQKLFQDYID